MLCSLEHDIARLADGLPRGADDSSLQVSLYQESSLRDRDLVSSLQEFDNSDTEDQPGAEGGSGTRRKRMSLWRSVHERLVWFRLVNELQTSSSGSLAVYLAALLNDR